MNELKALWKETEEFVERYERRIAEKYIHFLREVARHYISKGKRVFFRENRFVHYGEGGFGWLIVECDDDEYDVFDTHVPEVRFEKNVNEKDIRGSTEIRVENVKDIKYDI